MKETPREKDRQKDVQALFAAYAQNRCLALRNELVTKHLYIASMVARRYMGRGIDYDDLYQTASVALISAVERFDPAMGTAFSTFAVKTLLGVVKNYFRDHLSPIHVSRQISELTLQVRKKRGELTDLLKRAPYPDELAQALHLPVSDIVEAMEAERAQYPLSMDQDTQQEEDPLSSHMGEEEKGYRLVEIRDWLHRVVHTLNRQEKEIVHQRFDLGYSQRQVATNLKVSQMYVSRLERKILSQFRLQS